MQINEAISALQERVALPSSIDELTNSHLAQLLTNTAAESPDGLAFTSLGHSITFAELNALSDAFSVYIQQHTDLQKGDRLAIQLPNLIQYPVVFYGAIKAGLVVVNTNPLYTDRELVHQFNDSGAQALVVLANVAHSVQDVIPRTGIRYVIVTEVADLHGALSRILINFVSRYVKKLVPPYSIPNARSLRSCLAEGKAGNLQDPNTAIDDIALLQYTGGTTGLSKGAMLSHRNLLSNVAQQKLMFNTFKDFDDQQNQTVVLPLPLYHVYACTLCAFMVSEGQHCLLITNPRDLPSMVKTMSQWRFSVFCGLNTLFVALCARDDFKALDFSALSMTVSGGMALTSDAATRWQQVTGVEINEGYGLTETSPVVSINTGGTGRKLGSIGVTTPGTELKVIDAEGNALPCGEAGELCVRGPQVMQGYWQQPEKSAEVLPGDGWFATGDIAMVDEEGFPHIVDRKKDMVIVSGFNVYPNEVEEVISSHDKVLECAVIGVADERVGEKVKVFIVKSDPSLTEDEVIQYSRTQLTAYKVPSLVAFIDDLPKSNVGKILRRELRDVD
ncbi:AMP-binding protein [Pseudomonadales bacterium]|nr:AMP-binding protein [Pseudomonadales bacterium]